MDCDVSSITMLFTSVRRKSLFSMVKDKGPELEGRDGNCLPKIFYILQVLFFTFCNPNENFLLLSFDVDEILVCQINSHIIFRVRAC